LDKERGINLSPRLRLGGSTNSQCARSASGHRLLGLPKPGTELLRFKISLQVQELEGVTPRLKRKLGARVR